MSEVEEWMTPKRRFLSALFGGRVDRIPVGSVTSVATVEQMEATGAFFPEAHTDPKKMAKLSAAAHTILGYDAFLPYFSVWVEGDGLGTEVDWGDKFKMPNGKKHPFKDPEDVAIPDDFLERTAPAALLECIRILREEWEYGDRVAIIGKVMGPWTLSYHTAGITNFLRSIILKPDRVHDYLEALKELPVMFAKAQVEIGADVMMLADHATGDLVSGKTYRDFLLPVHQEITKKIGCPVVLHICGDTLDRLDYIAQAGFDCFHIDSKVDAFDAKKVTGKRISLMGNINNPNTLFYGTPEDVKKESLYAAKAGFEILAPECAIPTRVLDANLKAIVEIAKTFPVDGGP